MLCNRMTAALVLAAASIVGSVARGAEPDVAGVPAAKPAPASPAKPNIIFILSDDVGTGNIGCYGADHFQTPRIDELAKNGIRFDHCYSTPLCGPSRCQILTGRYPFRTGMTGNQTGSVLKPANEVMIPKVLKPAGYVTAQVGKWSQLPEQPGDWGFDEYLRFAGSGVYWREGNRGETYTLNGQTKDLPTGKYLPDVMHEFLIDFVTRHRDQPFYVHYAMSHIHGKIMRTPDSAPDSKDLYADNIAYMDKLVGRLVDDLERLKLREKTLLVFVGDNGTASHEAERSTIHGKPISGHRAQMLEGGSLVPMVVNWPGTAPAGRVSNDLVDFSDYFATFADMAGAKLPEGVAIDGRTFLPQIKGQAGQPREWIYVELNGRRYLRTSRWKLAGTGELYDMQGAPFAEVLVPADTTDADAIAARTHLQAEMEKLVGKERLSAPPGPDKKAKKAKRKAKPPREKPTT